MRQLKIEIPQYLTEKDGLIYVRTHDEHYLHQSFHLEDGKVIVFESIPENYPSNALCIFHSLKDYLSSIKEVSWINDVDYIVQHSPLLEEYGFPFVDENE